MVRVVGVRFKRAGKVYYFDPGEFELAKGDQVIVETARGIEFGETVGSAKEVTEEELTTPLKKVIRVATEADAAQLKENEAREKEAFGVAARKIAEHSLEMDLVDVEFTFDGNKIIFYFTAEGRVDFRELVRDLAAVFRTRIELRQIGVRDEAKMLGGIGPCGRALCCTTFLGDFAPVSIKMAKEQNLSLNPTKISGLCGRLLCCLRYESEHYERAKASFPPVGTPVSTKDGDGRVAAVNVIKGVVSVEFPTGVTHDYPADSVRSHGKQATPQRAESAVETPTEAAPGTVDEVPPIMEEDAVVEPVGEAVVQAPEAPASPCAGCAGCGGGGCPKAEAAEAELKEDAVLVAESTPATDAPPVVTVYDPPQALPEAGHAVGPITPAAQTGRPVAPRPRPDGSRRQNAQPEPGDRRQGDQRHGGNKPQGNNQRRNHHRSRHNNGERPHGDPEHGQANRPAGRPHLRQGPGGQNNEPGRNEQHRPE